MPPNKIKATYRLKMMLISRHIKILPKNWMETYPNYFNLKLISIIIADFYKERKIKMQEILELLLNKIVIRKIAHLSILE